MSLKETQKRQKLEYMKNMDLVHQMDSDESLRKSIPNEMMCREMMAKSHPHILLTNYAMLEYMLLRQIQPFFDNQSAKTGDLLLLMKLIHIKGATGTEISFLLRRVKRTNKASTICMTHLDVLQLVLLWKGGGKVI